MFFRRGMFYAPTACFADEGAADGGTEEGGGEAAKPVGDTLLKGATEDGKPASEAEAAAKAKEAEDGSHLAAPEGTPERPEFIDEQFWDAKKGEPRL